LRVVSGYPSLFSTDRVYTLATAVVGWLVAMNAAALNLNFTAIKKGEKIIVNTEGLIQEACGWPIITKG